MISTVVFAIGSIPIVWLSRRSLLHPTTHGFSRFFAFEAIFALIVLVGEYRGSCYDGVATLAVAATAKAEEVEDMENWMAENRARFEAT